MPYYEIIIIIEGKPIFIFFLILIFQNYSISENIYAKYIHLIYNKIYQ